jgi:hypothetical protein
MRENLSLQHIFSALFTLNTLFHLLPALTTVVCWVKPSKITSDRSGLIIFDGTTFIMVQKVRQKFPKEQAKTLLNDSDGSYLLLLCD